MSWFKNLKIRVKLLAAFIVVTCLLVFIGVYSIIQVGTIADSGAFVFENCTNPLGYLGFVTRDFFKMRINFRTLKTETDLNEIKKDQDSYYKTYESLQKLINLYQTGIANPTEKELYENFAGPLKTWVDLSSKCFDLKQQKGREQEFVENFTKAVALGNETAEVHLQKLVQYNVDLASQINDENTASATSAKVLMVIIIVICAVVAIVLAIYIAKIISEPIILIEHRAIEIANTGDLRTAVDVDVKDEIGSMNDALKKMIGNFGALIKKVMTEVDHITKESDDLSEISNVSASASTELQAQTQTAASSSEEVSANVSTVASSIEELSASIKEISKNTTSATALTKKSEERANEASKVMNRLGQSSQEIGNIVKSITDIAEQTNLLALNATIEAARAGEMGKGFAVVANEVKDLAKESAKATEDITHKIKAIQDDTKNAIDVIEEIIQNAIKINEVTTTIAAAVEEQSVTASEVNRNVSEATVGVNSIVEVITGITQAVSEYAKQANKLKTSSSSLKSLADGLDVQIKENFTV